MTGKMETSTSVRLSAFAWSNDDERFLLSRFADNNHMLYQGFENKLTGNYIYTSIFPPLRPSVSTQEVYSIAKHPTRDLFAVGFGRGTWSNSLMLFALTKDNGLWNFALHAQMGSYGYIDEQVYNNLVPLYGENITFSVRCVRFSHTGRYLALVTNSNPYIQIYELNGYKLSRIRVNMPFEAFQEILPTINTLEWGNNEQSLILAGSAGIQSPVIVSLIHRGNQIYIQKKAKQTMNYADAIQAFAPIGYARENSDEGTITTIDVPRILNEMIGTIGSD
jgi:WD40 repeat protein